MNQTDHWLLRRDLVFPLVAGFCDGILTALTLAAGRMLDALQPMTFGVALRVATGAFASGAFIFFVGHYATLRGELIRSERELSLAAHGRFARTRLGAAVLRDALSAAWIGSGCSFVGALIPSVVSALVPAHAWLGVAVATAILFLMGLGLGTTLYGNPIRWGLALALGGLALAYLGFLLQIA